MTSQGKGRVSFRCHRASGGWWCGRHTATQASRAVRGIGEGKGGRGVPRRCRVRVRLQRSHKTSREVPGPLGSEGTAPRWWCSGQITAWSLTLVPNRHQELSTLRDSGQLRTFPTVGSKRGAMAPRKWCDIDSGVRITPSPIHPRPLHATLP